MGSCFGEKLYHGGEQLKELGIGHNSCFQIFDRLKGECVASL